MYVSRGLCNNRAFVIIFYNLLVRLGFFRKVLCGLFIVMKE